MPKVVDATLAWILVTLSVLVAVALTAGAAIGLIVTALHFAGLDGF